MPRGVGAPRQARTGFCNSRPSLCTADGLTVEDVVFSRGAAAHAAVRDVEYATKCRLENTRLRGWLAEALAEHGVSSDTSMGNFVLARFASQAEAQSCDVYLQSKGLIVRSVVGYKLPNYLRITVGDESACRRVAHAVGQFKAGAT